MAMIVSVECPSCATAFPVDPDKVPHGGARTECTVCETPFRVDPVSWGDDTTESEPWVAPEAEPEPAAVSEDSDGTMDEFAPLEEAWSGDSGVESPDASWEDPGPSLDVALDAFEEPESDRVEGAIDDAVATDPVETDFAETDPVEADVSENVFAEAGSGGFDAPEAEVIEGGFGGFDVPEGEVAEADFGGIEGPEPPEFESVEFDSSALDAAELDAAELDPSGVEATDDESPEAVAGTGDLITDQWADLVDGDADEEAEISSDWTGDDGDTWVVETDDSQGLEIGEIELERLDTVEEHVRAAQEDPNLTDPAEGVDTNEVSSSSDGFGDFMSGTETVLPEDALEAGGPDLDLAAEDAGGEGFAPNDFAVETTAEASDTAAGFPGASPEVPEGGPEVPEAAQEVPEAAQEPVADLGVGGVADDVGSSFQFGRRDPHDKARRLARVLVSDMITYNPDRHAQALHNGSVKDDFEEEIEKSWAEYVEQVGPEIAESTDYWRDALNEILAGDQALF